MGERGEETKLRDVAVRDGARGGKRPERGDRAIAREVSLSPRRRRRFTSRAHTIATRGDDEEVVVVVVVVENAAPRNEIRSNP